MNVSNKKDYFPHLYSVFVLFGYLFLAACTPVTSIEPVEIPAKTVAPVKAEPKPVVNLPDVAILLSSQADAYRSVASVLEKSLNNRSKVFVLSPSRRKNRQIVEDIQKSDRTQVVAIGLRAAKVARSFKDRQIIFSQVFNYADYDFIKRGMKGVSAMPSPEQLFRDWKAIDPRLQRVAVITGDGLGDYMAQAIRAAENRGIALEHHLVKTDKEYLYVTKHLPVSIQGQWILPDNRVLSSKVLKEVMVYNSKAGKQTVVFNSKLFSFGALFYISITDSEISKLIVKRLNESAGKTEVPGVDMLPVSQHKMGINLKAANQQNLKIPEKYQQYINE